MSRFGSQACGGRGGEEEEEEETRGGEQEEKRDVSEAKPAALDVVSLPQNERSAAGSAEHSE